MRTWLQTSAAAALACALALALAACGSSAPHSNGLASKTPAQIVAAAEAAAAGAATVRVTGSIVSANEPISVDMELVAHKGAAGRLALEGFHLQLVNVDKAVYIRGDAAFYARFAGAAAARLLPGKWLKAPAANGPLASLTALTSLSRLISGTLSRHGGLSRAGTTTVAGQPALAVSDASGGATLYVASTGTPYPIEIVQHGSRTGRIVFDRWNKAVTLEVPPNPISVNELRSRP